MRQNSHPSHEARRADGQKRIISCRAAIRQNKRTGF